MEKTKTKKVVKAWAVCYLEARDGSEGYILENMVSTYQRECRERMAKVYSNHPTLWYELGWKRACKNKARIIPIEIHYQI